MNLDDLTKRRGAWLRGDGPNSDVVISSRIRLARNLAGFPFAARASASDFKNVVDKVVDAANAVLPKGDFEIIDFAALSEDDATLLHERQLVSQEFVNLDRPRALIFQHNEELSVMVNEEDHLRMQTTASGFVFKELWKKINEFDDLFESKLDYAFDKQFGYLTACPSNVGTGMRASVMLHLPGLIETGEISRVFHSLKKINLEVRGFYGEGSKPLGEFFQVSNQATLGLSEETIVEQLGQIVESVLKYERDARNVILTRDKEGLLDRCFRALATLQSARLLSVAEAMEKLSSIRLGVHMKLFNSITPSFVNEALVNIQPVHLRRLADLQGYSPCEDDVLRADYLREQFANVSEGK